MKHHILLPIIAMIIVGATAFAGKHDPDKIKSFVFAIERQAMDKVNETIKPEDIIDRYKLQTPIVPPRLDKNQVKALIAKEVEAAVEATHPAGHFQQIEVDAKNRHKMYKAGQKVLLKVKDPRRNRWIQIYHYIRRITPKGVQIGDTFVIFKDLHPGEFPHFFKSEHDTAVDNQISSRTTMYKRLRAEYEKKAKRSLSKKIWRSEGYVYRKKKRVYVPREEIFGMLYQRAWKKAYVEIRPEVETEIMTESGFTWNEDLERWEDFEAAAEDPATADDDDADDATTTKEKGPKKGGDSTIGDWRNKLDNLWKTKDKNEDEAWDKDKDKTEKDEGKGEKKTEKEAAKKPVKAKSGNDKKREELFGDD